MKWTRAFCCFFSFIKKNRTFKKEIISYIPKSLCFVWLFFSYYTQTSQWAVVTTINYPTDDLIKLVQQKEWHVVVVADKKTPKDWFLPGCDFLSVEKQEQLNYRIAKFIPWNHYCRKNIGYLYAIAHGATVVYDTDDDNALSCETLECLPAEAELPVCKTTQLCVNPYAHFGQPSIWPRGYPLECIQQKDSFAMTTKKVHPLIQQGLVNNDPDVDAIFRLTRGEFITFSNKDPLCLPAGTLCPFNSQNTIVLYDALWSLIIPVTTAFRVCDIWRGYWAQRLLWDIGGSLCFTGPNVIQKRNIHTLMKDFVDELDLYIKAGTLARMMQSWRTQGDTLADRMRELTIQMAQQGFWDNKEIELVNAWIEDLIDARYKFPDIAR